MSAPMTDLHLSHVLRLGLRTIRSNPEKYLKEIFGEATIEPHSKIYGQRLIDQAAKWIKETEVPIILGFDLVDAKMPAITVHLSGSTPVQSFIGDESIGMSEELGHQEKEVLVPAFQPAGVDNTNPDSLKLILPDSMSFELQQLFLPGLLLRDSKNREYSIATDDDGNILIQQASESAPLSEMDMSRLEVVSPVIEARFSGGAMQYQETATIVVHGNSNRQEGLWVYYIVMWTLLKFRPVLTHTMGLDLSMPTASDYSKDDQFMGDNVWRRFITVQAQTLWSWEQARHKDILGLLLSVSNGRVDNC